MATARGLPLGLRAAYLAMHRQTDICLARSHCTADQFVLLGLLARGDAVTQQELVRRASSDPNTVRAMLVLLEKRGLVARVGHPTDGRARSVTLTDRGRRLHARQRADTEPLRKRLRSLFSPEEAKSLVEFLARISEALVVPRRSSGRGRQKENQDVEETTVPARARYHPVGQALRGPDRTAR